VRQRSPASNSGREIKQISRCPQCQTTNIAARKTKSPRFRCDDCHSEFEDPIVTHSDVTNYRTDHEQAWADLTGVLDGPTLRGLTGYSQNSIRRIDWNRFAPAIEAAAGPNALAPVTIAHAQVIAGGHTSSVGKCANRSADFPCRTNEKVRIQLRIHGASSCRGARSVPSLQLRGVGRHDFEGGLLLRRDLHRLFDQGFLAVASDGVIDVAESLKPCALYSALHGQRLNVATTPQQRNWLALHWTEWRKPATIGSRTDAE
jgi:hypothetical protein